MNDDCAGRKIGDWGHPFAEPEPGKELAEDKLCRGCRSKMLEANKTYPTSWEMFAEQREGHFEHFFPSTMQVKMCGDGPIFLVRLSRDAEGPYWGWLHSHHPYNSRHGGTISMIFRFRQAVEICFPYGVKSATELGHGEVIRMSAEVIRSGVHPEGLK